MSDRKPIAGLRHVALNVTDLHACEQFYIDLVGMTVEWRPDADNVYLTSGADNLALHRAASPAAAQGQRLDHIGFALVNAEEVSRWHDYLREQGVTMKTAPKAHRDGSHSFYCLDPDGTIVQFIYHPPLV